MVMVSSSAYLEEIIQTEAWSGSFHKAYWDVTTNFEPTLKKRRTKVISQRTYYYVH